METTWKTRKGNVIIQKEDGFFKEDGTPVNMDGESPESLGWQEHIPEPAIETFSEGPSEPPSKAVQVMDALTPNRAAMARQGKTAWEQFMPNSPALQTLGEVAGGTAGLGMDAASMLYSPARAATGAAAPAFKKGFEMFLKSRPVEAAKNMAAKMNPSINAPSADKAMAALKQFVKGGMPQTGNVPGSKSLPAIAGKNFAMNTGDAALFNNAERLAKGEGVEFGVAELAGGLAGGAPGTLGEKVSVNNVLRARNAAAKNAESLNFAEHATGKKGLRAVEQVIDQNVAQHGTFAKAVDNIRADTDKLNKEMSDFMAVSGMKEIPYPAQELKSKIDNFVLEKTSFLGNKNSREYAAAANEAFDESLKEIWVERMKQQGLGNTRFLSDYAANLPAADLHKEVPSLTLAELNQMKVNMQKRSSHWQRSQGSMAREGTESLANKEASDAINNMLDGISSTADNAVEEWVEKNAKTLLPADAAKFREINKARSNAIGNLKIMEHADRVQSRRDDFLSGLTNSLSEMNYQNRGWVPSLSRWGGSNAAQTDMFQQYTKKPEGQQ